MDVAAEARRQAPGRDHHRRRLLPPHARPRRGEDRAPRRAGRRAPAPVPLRRLRRSDGGLRRAQPRVARARPRGAGAGPQARRPARRRSSSSAPSRPARASSTAPTTGWRCRSWGACSRPIPAAYRYLVESMERFASRPSSRRLCRRVRVRGRPRRDALPGRLRPGRRGEARMKLVVAVSGASGAPVREAAPRLPGRATAPAHGRVRRPRLHARPAGRCGRTRSDRRRLPVQRLGRTATSPRPSPRAAPGTTPWRWSPARPARSRGSPTASR